MATREESVRLSLKDDFTSGMARAAAATALLKRELDGIDGKRIDRGLGEAAVSADRVAASTGRAGPEIDKFSGRLRLLVDTAATLGPALIPLGVSILPAIAAGANGLGAAVGGILVTTMAFNGLGDALKALDTYQLDKTPENLDKLRQAQDALGPSGAQFLHYLDQLEPKLSALQMLARDGLFPGLESGIDDLLSRLPAVRNIVIQLSEGMGQLAADAGKALSSDTWTPFFDFLQSNARPTLEGFARATGNVIETFANLLVAFAPLSRMFTDGLEGMTQSLARWSQGLGSNKDFQAFLAYIRESGPQAVELLGSIATAFASIVEAAAPYGAVVLPVLTQLADLLALVANSDAGTPLIAGAAALLAYGRAANLVSKATGSSAAASLKGFGSALTTVISAQDRATMSANELAAAEAKRDAALSKGFRTIGKGAGVLAGLGIAASGAADGLGLTNTASLALMGTVAGPWGAAVGGGLGLLLDWRDHSQKAQQAAAEFTGTLDQQTGAITENTRAMAIKNLQDSGALEAAQKLGISLQLVTDAALGNATAQTQLNDALDKYQITATAGRGAAVTGYGQAGAAADKVRGSVLQLSGAVAASQAIFHQQTSAMGTTTHAANTLRAAYDSTTDAAQGLSDQLKTLDDFLNNRGTFRAYEADLDNLRKSLKDAPHAFSAMGAAGRTNLGNLDQIISDASRHLDTLTDPHRKAAFLRDVIDQLHQIGKTSPEAQAAIRNVIPKLREVQSANKQLVIKVDNADAMKKTTITNLALRDLALQHPVPKIDADGAQAEHTINGVKALLRELNGTTATTYVRTIHTTQIRPGTSTVDPHAAIPGGADGMTVPGKRHPYGDKLLILAAPGEEIITNRHGEADRFRADRAAGVIPRYAGGGTAGGDPAFHNMGGHGGNGGGGGGGPWITILVQGAYSAAKALKAWQAELDQSKKGLEKRRSQLDATNSAMSSLSGSIADHFNVDLGARPSNVWAAGGGGLLATITQMTSQANALPGIIAALKAAGLTGPALAEVLQEMDFSQLAALAATPSQAGQLGTALSGLYSAQQVAGSAAGQSVYGAQQAAQMKALQAQVKELHAIQNEVRELRKDVRNADKNNQQGHKQNAKDVKDGVNGAASNGHRRRH